MQHEINKILENLLHIVVRPDRFPFGVYSVPNQQELIHKASYTHYEPHTFKV